LTKRAFCGKIKISTNYPNDWVLCIVERDKVMSIYGMLIKEKKIMYQGTPLKQIGRPSMNVEDRYIKRSISLPPSLAREMEEICKGRNIGISEYIREVLLREIEGDNESML
jgi:hypothetical protein